MPGVRPQGRRCLALAPSRRRRSPATAPRGPARAGNPPPATARSAGPSRRARCVVKAATPSRRRKATQARRTIAAPVRTVAVEVIIVLLRVVFAYVKLGTMVMLPCFLRVEAALVADDVAHRALHDELRRGRCASGNRIAEAFPVVDADRLMGVGRGVAPRHDVAHLRLERVANLGAEDVGLEPGDAWRDLDDLDRPIEIGREPSPYRPCRSYRCLPIRSS